MKIATLIHTAVLDQIRERGGRWAVYENQDMGHPDQGQLQFIKYGPGCTYPTPPPHAPDTEAWGLGWRFRHAGYVDLVTGKIVEHEPDPVN